jgi:hypothetical protein
MGKSIKGQTLLSHEGEIAIAQIFARCSQDPRDIFTTSTFALAFCTFGQIRAVLQLPVECEWREFTKDGGELYGWRSNTGNNLRAEIMWHPAILAPIAKEAILRVRTLTAKARDLAEWLENNPSSFYRHEGCPKVDSDIPLTAKQAATAMGVRSVAALGLSPLDFAHTLNSLWKWVRQHQPVEFPWINRKMGLKYSNALFCMTRNMLDEQRPTSPVILWTPTVDTFIQDVSSHDAVSYGPSIFDRWGYKSLRGNSLSLSLSSSREWLSTLPEIYDLPFGAIAKWAGSNKQNASTMARTKDR